ESLSLKAEAAAILDRLGVDKSAYTGGRWPPRPAALPRKRSPKRAACRAGRECGAGRGDSNPFPVIRVPWDRDNPWQSVFLHEVAHNLQADMGL
ncbi:hypothetical protein EN810_37420, partial [Mesorhizobium sp. M8A.F.Ca.ET.167.01.1.1]